MSHGMIRGLQREIYGHISQSTVIDQCRQGFTGQYYHAGQKGHVGWFILDTPTTL